MALAAMQVYPPAQRNFNAAHAKKIAANFDPEKMGTFVVSRRDGVYWIVDGQHRAAAMQIIGYDDQHVECDLYEGLTPAQEAELFLGRNDRLSVTSLDRFKVAVTAERPEELSINRIVTNAGLKIGTGYGYISAVSTLSRIYRELSPDVLVRTLPVVNNAWGPDALDALTIEAAAMVIHRYPGLDDTALTARLKGARGGIGAIRTAAEALRTTTSLPRQQCMASEMVTTYNRGRGGAKITPWFHAGAAA